MDDYEAEIDGKYDLTEITSAIAGEEAGGSEFGKNTVSVRKNKATNIATFHPLPAGTFPKELTVLRQGAPAPGGKIQLWSGAMIVKGTNTAVVVYRAS